MRERKNEVYPFGCVKSLRGQKPGVHTPHQLGEPVARYTRLGVRVPSQEVYEPATYLARTREVGRLGLEVYPLSDQEKRRVGNCVMQVFAHRAWDFADVAVQQCEVEIPDNPSVTRQLRFRRALRFARFRQDEISRAEGRVIEDLRSSFMMHAHAIAQISSSPRMGLYAHSRNPVQPLGKQDNIRRREPIVDELFTEWRYRVAASQARGVNITKMQSPSMLLVEPREFGEALDRELQIAPKPMNAALSPAVLQVATMSMRFS